MLKFTVAYKPTSMSWLDTKTEISELSSSHWYVQAWTKRPIICTWNIQMSVLDLDICMFWRFQLIIDHNWLRWLFGTGEEPLPKSTRYVDGTPTSEVTPVTIRYIHPPHHGYPWVTVMVMNDRLTALSFRVNQRPHHHSSNKAISNFDL